MDLELIIRQYDFNLAYARALVEDIPERDMRKVPAEGLVNHAAFTLGHLVTGAAITAEDLGGPYDIPEGWKELFQRRGPGDPRQPEPDNNQYPSKAELLDELERQHNTVKRQLRSVSEAKLMEPVSWRFNDLMPTLLDAVVFLCINHEAMHLGQLAAWRRAMGYGSALADM